jgi:hypothetical protein
MILAEKLVDAFVHFAGCEKINALEEENDADDKR